MASDSSVQKGFSFVWKTTFSFYSWNVESSVFDFMNTKWNLRISSPGNASSCDSFFNLHLINWNRTKPYQPFQVTTFLYRKSYSSFIRCSLLNIASAPFVTLYTEKISEITKQLNFDRSSRYPLEISIMCVFFLSDDQSLDITTEIKDKSVQASVECECQKKSSVSCIDNSVTSFSSESCELSLKSLLHLKSLSEDIGDMLQKNIMTDIQLKCGEIITPAHKAVLASRSKVFSSMFQHEMVESISGTVDIQDIEPSVLHEFLKYLYTGMISEDLPSEIYFKLYKVSDKYEVHMLQEECANIMVKKLNEENFIEFLMLGEEHNDQKLKDAVAKLIIERPLLMTMDIWIKFSDEFPKLANEIYKTYVKNTISK